MDATPPQSRTQMKKICIYALDDGTFSLEVEPQESMGMEGMEAEGQEMPASPMDMQEDAAEGETEQVFQSVDEVLEAARMELGDQGAAPMMEGEQEFVAGFKQARGGEGMGY